MILSTEEQSSRRREQNEAVRRGGNAAQGAHGKPGVPAGGRATGGLRTAAIDAHTSDGLTKTSGSAGASSQVRAESAATGRDQVAEARSSINRKKGQEPARGPAPSTFWEWKPVACSRQLEAGEVDGAGWENSVVEDQGAGLLQVGDGVQRRVRCEDEAGAETGADLTEPVFECQT